MLKAYDEANTSYDEANGGLWPARPTTMVDHGRVSHDPRGTILAATANDAANGVARRGQRRIVATRHGLLHCPWLSAMTTTSRRWRRLATMLGPRHWPMVWPERANGRIVVLKAYDEANTLYGEANGGSWPARPVTRLMADHGQRWQMADHGRRGLLGLSRRLSRRLWACQRRVPASLLCTHSGQRARLWRRVLLTLHFHSTNKL